MGSLPHILVINPNTSANVSAMIDGVARDELGSAAEIATITARFGFSYISTRTAVAVASHAVLDAAASALEERDILPGAIVLACFGDPGREALAEMTGIPVLGFAEAGLAAAVEHAGTTLLATSGTVWCDMLEELALKSRLSGKIAGIRSIDAVTGSDEAVAEFLETEAKALGATQIVLGGAGLMPRLPAIIAASGIPIIDPHRLTFRRAIEMARGNASTQAAETVLLGSPSGLSPALQKVLEHRG